MSDKRVAMLRKLVTLHCMSRSASTKEIRWLLQEKYHGVETPEFHADVARLQAGEPLAYVIGWVDFLDCRIDLSAHPLIPRPETEFWVDREIAGMKKAHGTTPLRILDLFSGSGCIGIALAKHLPAAHIDLGEKDPLLCAQIRKNLTLNNINPGGTRVVETDVFSNITDTYDHIFANPPYIDPQKKDTVENSVLLHEPHEALFARHSGLGFIEKLLMEAPLHLTHGGILSVEFGEGQKEDIARLAKQHGLHAAFFRDQFERWRVAKLTVF
jgi:HemK-like putative methylase